MNNDMDIFEDKGATSVAPDSLDILNKKLTEAINLTLYIEHMEGDLAAAKTNLHNMNTSVIPDLMASLGVEKITQRGWEVDIKGVVGGSFPKEDDDPEKHARAIRWLEDNKAGQLIKTFLTVPFTKGQHNMAIDAAERLRSEGFPAELKSGVHPQTLAAFGRERLKSGEPLDTDLLGLFIERKAKFKKPKED